MYDYLLGGKNNFAADRETAEKALQSWGTVRTAARENRAFLGRAVRYLVAEAGIRQFLDIGTGLPSANNVHEVAQGLVPSCRVVYVDNDPIVLAHARALLTSSPEGKTAYIQADLREPEKILAGFNSLIQKAPRFAEAYNQRAVVYFRLGELAKSIADCEKALKLNPYHFGAAGGMAQCFMKQKKFRAALRTFRRAFRLNPNLDGVQEVITSLEKMLGEGRNKG